MVVYLGVLLFALCVFMAAIVPFIDLLYRLKFTYKQPLPPSTPLEKKVFLKMQKNQRYKFGTPIGGGVLIIVIVCLLFSLIFPSLIRLGFFVSTSHPLKEELNVIFFTFISFGLLGLYSDLVKNFTHRLTVKFLLSLFCGLLIYTNLGINSVYLPVFGNLSLGGLYPIFAGLIIFLFSRAVNITDGLDGLTVGNLVISLFALWVLSLTGLDTPISIFISLWISGLLVFLYFNIFPARIWLGNSGAISFGATFAVIGLILGKIAPLLLIGGVFMIEFFSWLIQTLSVRILGRRAFIITPIHYWLILKGWPEPKIVMRSWLLGILLAFCGLWLS